MVILRAVGLPMSETPTFQGALQATLMRVLWTAGGGTVQEIRGALSPDDEHAYNTIQTVLNRLADRGLADREKRGAAFVYKPAVAEPDYVSGAIGRLLGDASPDAREAALAQLVGGLDRGELRKLEKLAGEVDARRGKKPA